MALLFSLYLIGHSFVAGPMPDSGSADSLIRDFDTAVYLNADYQECITAAENLVALGDSLGNQEYRARGMVRLVYAELLFGKQGSNWFKNFAEVEELLEDKTSIAHAEFLLYSGYAKGKWLKAQGPGIADLEKSIWMLTQRESDDRLALACALCSELYGLKEDQSRMCDLGYRATYIAEGIESLAIKSAALRAGITAMRAINDFDAVARLSKKLLEIDHESDAAWHGLYVAGKSDKWEQKALRRIEDLKGAAPLDLFHAGQIASYYIRLSMAAFQRDQIDVGLKHAESAVHFAELSKSESLLVTANECSIYGGIFKAESTESLDRILEENADLENSCSLKIAAAFKGAYRRVGSMEKSLLWSGRETERALELRAIEYENASNSANNYWANELKSREQRLDAEKERHYALTLFWALLTIGSAASAGIIFWLLLRRERSRLEKRVEDRTLALTNALQTATTADRAKTEFLSQINHEIRNPLAAIIGYCSLLKQKAGETEEFINGIFSSSQHLSELVDDVLEVSKIENRDLEVEHLPFDIGLTVHELGESMSEKTVGKRIDFECNLRPGSARQIVSDEAKIWQLAISLISNAVKFTARGKVSVVFEITRNDSSELASLQFRVVDAGIGIPDADRDQVFDRYFKASNNDTVSGSGLGLYVAQKIVDALQGSIELTSKVNVGTSVEVNIPVKIVESSPIGTKDDSSPGASSPKILVIDDQEAVRQTLVLQFENAGYDSQAPQSVEKAFGMIKLWKPEFVLLDIHMPGLSGFEILSQIRELYAPKSVFVVAITGDATDVVKQECKVAGFDAFLAKPFQLDAVERLVVRAGLQLPGRTVGARQNAIPNPALIPFRSKESEKTALGNRQE